MDTDDHTFFPLPLSSSFNCLARLIITACKFDFTGTGRGGSSTNAWDLKYGTCGSVGKEVTMETDDAPLSTSLKSLACLASRACIFPFHGFRFDVLRHCGG